MATPKKLNDKHKRCLQLIAEGLSGKDAAIEAGFSPRSASEIARQIKLIPGASEYLARLSSESHSDAVASIQERKEILTEIARDRDCKTVAARISAIHMLNKMDALYTEKLEVNQAGGVMLVPMTQSLENWEEIAVSAQKKLQENS